MGAIRGIPSCEGGSAELGPKYLWNNKRTDANLCVKTFTQNSLGTRRKSSMLRSTCNSVLCGDIKNQKSSRARSNNHVTLARQITLSRRSRLWRECAVQPEM